jgi:tRNA A37 threonylcarbamoyladenosine dehydratase
MQTDADTFNSLDRLYGRGSAAKLAHAHVMVIGIGGVGSWIAEALARSGVGTISLVDMDEVCVSNINRQLHTLTTTIGKSKVQVMAERLRLINSQLTAYTHDVFFTEETGAQLLTAKPTLVIDAIDSLKNKVLIYKLCQELEIPLIVTGGAAGKRDPSKIKIEDLSLSRNDKLLKKMRRKLRDTIGFPPEGEPCGTMSIYSWERAVYPGANGEICEERPGELKGALDCGAGMGSAAFVTGAFGLAAASCAVATLTK